MKKLFNIIKEAALFIWQLPQNIIGLILVLFYRPEKKLIAKNGNYVYLSRYMPGGISLGKYSIISRLYCIGKTDEQIIDLDVSKHEALGHGTQSRWLGPFYLPVIGLPSIIWAGLYGSVIPYTTNGYYRFYTEKWADKLAGIKRV
jgi:hypothetical protein